MLALCVEIGLRVYGLGDPGLYEVNPLYGYRPKAHQTVRRIRGAMVHTNNIGLRANTDWDSASANKVLFLGNSVTYGGSYVSNNEVFSELALRGMTGWVAGDGGVNGWGGENIHGLVVRSGFHPARVYVTVLIENDFYRGLVSKPAVFPTTKPLLALQEAWPHITTRLHEAFRASEEAKPKHTVEDAVVHLVQLDSFVRARGAIHLIYLSPYLSNLTGSAAPDAQITSALAKSGLTVTRIAQRAELKQLDAAQLYHDDAHLSAAGHAVWAKIIRAGLDSALQRAPR